MRIEPPKLDAFLTEEEKQKLYQKETCDVRPILSTFKESVKLQIQLLKEPKNFQHLAKESVKPKNIFKTLALLFVLMLFAMTSLMFFHKQHQKQKELEMNGGLDNKQKNTEEIIGSDLGHAYTNPIRRDLHDNAILIRDNPRDGYVRNNRPDGNYSSLPKLPQPIPFPSQIMLLTAWRSGGSYVSEIFNQHPEVFYFSSPLVLVEGIHPKKKDVFGIDPKENIRNTKMKILDGFFSSECVLPRIEDYWNPLINNYIATHGIECWDDGVCMRYLSNCLKRPPICERDLTDQLDMTPQEVTRLCPFKDKIHYAEMLCMASAVRVAKVGRFTTVQELPKILRDGEALKSIMVVRDPRAILLSRMTKMKGYFEYSNKMIKEICTEWDTILRHNSNTKAS